MATINPEEPQWKEWLRTAALISTALAAPIAVLAIIVEVIGN